MMARLTKKSASFWAVAYRSVAYWCVHGDPDNLETLKDGREKGNYRKADEAYIQLLVEVIEKNPSELGYEFERWSANRLATYLTEKTGIKLSGEQVRTILKKKKYVYLWGAGSPDRVLCPANPLQNTA